MDYKDTLNLPKTDFKMKANLPQREPDIAKFWESIDIHSKLEQAFSGKEKYVLHDGPPYANGHIHLGHALNKTLKDMVIKYKTMRGYHCEYVPGWDCHGLPVEHQLLKKLKKRKDDIEQVEFRKKAFEYAAGFVDIQREEFKRLGVFGEWQDPYLTTDKDYEVAIISSFARLVEQGYIYKGLKPVNYCYRCETALAEAEVEYDQHTSPSVYVKFHITNPEFNPAGLPDKKTYLLIWTTTPWTLIANVAVAVHPEAEYVFLEIDNNETIIMAKELLEKVSQNCSIENHKISPTVKGKDLQHLKYSFPLSAAKNQGQVVTAEYVSMEEGTGCVHTAPGHGQDDYSTGQKYSLETVMPVDEKGRFTNEAGEFAGINVHKANDSIKDKLISLGLLLHSDSITHSYPHCWRCKNPIIFRATEQWFMSIDHNGLRKKLLEKAKEVEWVPIQGQQRISTMIENRPDWCLSRQRYWGVPIPVFMCKSCKKWIADPKVINHFAGIVKEKGTDAWFELEPKDLLPDGYKCPYPNCEGNDFQKGEDILDVWFESGVSHEAVLRKRKNLSYPADLYLEGSDQHRGWFQSSLITSMAMNQDLAFKSVLTHGFVVDGEGRKMSKSLGNVISAQEIIKNYGADILRLWVAFSDYNDDIRISDTIIARLTDAYRKIRNTARFILGNIYDFNPDEDKVSYEEMDETDKWAVLKAHRLLRDINGFYKDFQFHKVYHSLYAFCIVDMSNFYMDIVKDILYTFKSDSARRRSCQSALYEILDIIAKVIAPVMVFTSEEIFQSMPKEKLAPESIHLSLLHDATSLKMDNALELKYEKLKKIRNAVLKVLEANRVSGIIRSSLEAKVRLSADSEDTYNFLAENELSLPALFIVSQVELCKQGQLINAVTSDDMPGISIQVDKAEGEKCDRCWNFSKTTGSNKDYPGTCQRCQDVLIAMKGDSTE